MHSPGVLVQNGLVGHLQRMEKTNRELVELNRQHSGNRIVRGGERGADRGLAP